MPMDNNAISVTVNYFAKLREERGQPQETLKILPVTARELYAQLKDKHALSLPASMMRVAVNEEFVSWDRLLQDGDEVTFIPPVSGG